MSDSPSPLNPDNPNQRPEIDALGELLQDISWKMMRMESLRMADFGLTAPQAITLQAVDQFGPDIDMATLAANTMLPASSITSIVDRFDEQGLLVRSRHATDRRRVTASLTESGKALCTRIEAGSLELLAWLFEDVDRSTIELANGLFRHINTKLDKQGRATPET